jgi:hypothetical protein
MNSAEKSFNEDRVRALLVRDLAGTVSHGKRSVLCLALLLSFSSPLSLAQSSSDQTGPGQLSNNPLRLERKDAQPTADEPAIDPALEQRQLLELNAKLHKAIVSDTDKLLKMVAELNAEIGGTDPASLTPEQLRKVAAIEKLAHSLRDKMRFPIKDPPALIDAAKPLHNYPEGR